MTDERTPAPDTVLARVRAAILNRLPEAYRPAAELVLAAVGVLLAGLLARYGF